MRTWPKKSIRNFLITKSLISWNIVNKKMLSIYQANKNPSLFSQSIATKRLLRYGPCKSIRLLWTFKFFHFLIPCLFVINRMSWGWSISHQKLSINSILWAILSRWKTNIWEAIKYQRHSSWCTKLICLYLIYKKLRLKNKWSSTLFPITTTIPKRKKYIFQSTIRS